MNRTVMLSILLDISQEVSIGKRVFTITGDSPVHYQCHSYGFNMSVESGTLLPNEKCDIIVEPLICGKFEFPDNSVVVSGIYNICCSGDKPLKHITLEIQHCVDLKTEEQCKSMQFMIAERSDGPHHFKPVSEGEFSLFSQYGKIKRKHFCKVCIRLDGSTYNEVILFINELSMNIVMSLGIRGY